MGTSDNKAVVQRFWDELILGGRVDVVDELLAPDYKNLIVEGIAPVAATETPSTNGETRSDRDALKDAILAFHGAVDDIRMEVLALAAEGDAVFARIRFLATLPDGTESSSRGLGYYRVVDGRIVMNDILSVSE